MHGSVKEWCYDFYGKYSNEGATNPIGPIRGKTRVLRRSFYRTAYECRSSSRDKLDPSWRGSEIGFRVVLGFPLDSRFIDLKNPVLLMKLFRSEA